MFDLEKHTVRLSNFNARSELNGETRKPAADISCSAIFPNAILNELCPGLLEMLYEAPKDPDLVEQTDPTARTSLRMLILKTPLKLQVKLDNRKLTIDYGLGGDSDIVLTECKVPYIDVEPLQGGSTQLSWPIQGHPDAAQAGWLYEHQQTDIVISLEEIKQPGMQADMLAAHKPHRPTKAEKQEAARAAAEAAFIQTGETADAQ